VLGSTVFSSHELAKVTAPFSGRPITFAELLEARSAVTQLYIDKGYITSGAYIPADQVIQGGVVVIQVLEGGLEAIQVTGTKRLNPGYVRDRLAIATAKPLNVNRLLKALQLLQLDPLIKNLSAELSAGTHPGMNLLEVRVTEANALSTQITLANNRPPSIGSFQRQVQINQANLLGLGDGISLAYGNTNGSHALNTSYTLPVNARNGTVSISYSNIWSRIIEPPFDRLNIKGNSWDLNLTLRQPLIQGPTNEFALGLTAAHREGNTSLLGVPFPLSAGSDQQGRTRISELRFFQEWTQQGSKQVLAIRSEFGFGLDVLNATVHKQPPDGRFFAWRGQVQWLRLLAPDMPLLLRSNLQLADRALVPSEQFSLGGLESVRGYRQDLLLVDNGAFASAEVRVPIYRLSRQRGVLQLAPFVDFGTGWNSSSQKFPGPHTLVSIGLGLQWQWGDHGTVRFDWGIPLVSVDASKNSLQEKGLYFSIVVNPF
jgi:hemolysin activation/secretion protein